MLSYKCLFDSQWATAKLEQDNKRRAEKVHAVALTRDESGILDALAQQADRALRTSAYHTVDFANLFGGFASAPAGEAGSSSA